MIRMLLLTLFLFFFSTTDAQTSRNGEFFAHIVVRGEAKNHREYNTWSAQIMAKNGTVRYRLARETAFDVQFPSIHLADDGSAIVVNVFDGIVEFYDDRGYQRNTLQPFGGRTAEHEQVIKCSVSGNTAVLLCSTPDWPTARVIVTNLLGQEQWSIRLSGKQAGEVFLSSDEQRIAAGSYTMTSTVQSTTQVFDKGGKLITVVDGAFRFADISSDGFMSLSDRNSVRLIQLSESNPMFMWNTATPNEVITSVKIVNGHVVSVVESVAIEGGIPIYKKPRLIVLNRKGLMTAESALDTSSSNPASLLVDRRNITMSSNSKQTAIAISAFE